MLQFVVLASRGREIGEQFTAGVFPRELFYMILLFVVLFQALFYHMSTKELVIDTEQFEYDELAPQAVGGLVVGLLVAAPLAIVGRTTVPAHLFSELVTQVLYVAFVETVFMIVALKTIWFRGHNVGVFAWPFLFATLHPYVRDPWLRGEFTPESLAGFAYAGIFGVLFESLYLAREAQWRGTFLGYDKASFFGAVTVWVAHIAINAVLLVRVVSAGAFSLFPLNIGW